MKRFLSSAGFTLVEAMVVAGIMGGLSIYGMNLYEKQMQAQNKMEIQNDMLLLTGNIGNILRDTNSCQASIQGITAPVIGGAAVNIPTIFLRETGPPVVNTPIYGVGAPATNFLNNKYTIGSFGLRTTQRIGSVLAWDWTGTILITYNVNNSQRFGLPPQIIREIPITFSTVPSSMVVQSCYTDVNQTVEDICENKLEGTMAPTITDFCTRLNLQGTQSARTLGLPNNAAFQTGLNNVLAAAGTNGNVGNIVSADGHFLAPGGGVLVRDNIVTNSGNVTAVSPVANRGTINGRYVLSNGDMQANGNLRIIGDAVVNGSQRIDNDLTVMNNQRIANGGLHIQTGSALIDQTMQAEGALCVGPNATTGGLPQCLRSFGLYRTGLDYIAGPIMAGGAAYTQSYCANGFVSTGMGMSGGWVGKGGGWVNPAFYSYCSQIRVGP